MPWLGPPDLGSPNRRVSFNRYESAKRARERLPLRTGERCVVSDSEHGLLVTTLVPPSPAPAEGSSVCRLPDQSRVSVADAHKSTLPNDGAQADVLGSIASLDRAYFSRRIEEELPFLRKTVRRWHRDRANAEDLVQDTVVQALANAHLWQPGSNLRAWLVTIMRNQFLAAVAKSKRSADLLATIAGRDDHWRPDTSGARLLLRDVERGLRRLTAIQRAVLVAVGIDGKSYTEVAQTLGLSVGAVRCHLARARDRLRAAVEGGRYAVPFAPRSAPRPLPNPPCAAPRAMPILAPLPIMQSFPLPTTGLPILRTPARDAIPTPAVVGAD